MTIWQYDSKTPLKSTTAVAIKRTSDWIVSLEDDGSVWEYGKTLEEAIGKMKKTAGVDILILKV